MILDVQPRLEASTGKETLEPLTTTVEQGRTNGLLFALKSEWRCKRKGALKIVDTMKRTDTMKSIDRVKAVDTIETIRIVEPVATVDIVETVETVEIVETVEQKRQDAQSH